MKGKFSITSIILFLAGIFMMAQSAIQDELFGLALMILAGLYSCTRIIVGVLYRIHPEMSPAKEEDQYKAPPMTPEEREQVEKKLKGLGPSL